MVQVRSTLRYAHNLFTLADLFRGFEAIEPELIRFPSLDAAVLRRKVEQFIASCEHRGVQE